MDVDTLSENVSQSRGTPSILGASEWTFGGVLDTIGSLAKTGSDVFKSVTGSATPSDVNTALAQQQQVTTSVNKQWLLIGGAVLGVLVLVLLVARRR